MRVPRIKIALAWLVILLALIGCGGDSSSETPTTSTLSFGPATAQFRYWIDQANPVPSMTTTWQKFKQVFTAPVPVGEYLASVSFYVSQEGTASSASYFMVRLTEWSDRQLQTIGPPLYESGHVSISNANTPFLDVLPTFFEPNVVLIPGHRYIIEILGDGEVFINVVHGGAPYEDGLYFIGVCCGVPPESWPEDITWSPMLLSLRSDMAFSQAP